jgi:hypothetical protein
MHVMIDLETLGNRPNGLILQIGAVLFEPASGGKLLNNKGLRATVMPQDGGGTIDGGTIAWWFQQPNVGTLGKRMATEGVPLSDALKQLVEFPQTAHGIGWEAIQGVWSNGAAYDQPILASSFALFGLDVPWHFRASECCRTLFKRVGGPPDIDWTGFEPHDALDDAIGQAMQVQKAMGMLRG